MPDVDPDLVKRLAELVDAPPWEMADLLAERFPEAEFGKKTGVKTGLYVELEAYEDAIRKDHGIELKASTMRSYRSTAIAWPGDVRTPPASFEAFRRLRGADRFDLMQRYLKRNKGEPLSGRHVARYRADDNPKPPKPWDAAARQRIESTVKSLLLGAIVTKRDDWWNVPGVDESRDALRSMLYDLYQRMDQS